MIRAAAELQRRALRHTVVRWDGASVADSRPVHELRWNIDRNLYERARRDLRSVLDNQQATFDLSAIGRRSLSSLNLEPVALFVVGLQVAVKRLIGKVPAVSQFLTTSKFRCGDLATADVTTPEVVQFVEYAEGSGPDARHARDLLRNAVESQTRVCRRSRSALSFMDMLALYLRSARGLRGFLAGWIMWLSFLVLRLMGKFRSDREIVVSHPKVYPEVPVMGRPGIRLPYVRYFALHYQIMEEKTVITLMPSVEWTIPNAELIAVIREALQRIQCLAGDAEPSLSSPG
jgi:hypothetical protein